MEHKSIGNPAPESSGQLWSYYTPTILNEIRIVEYYYNYYCIISEVF